VEYGRAFQRWTKEDVPSVQKMRERGAFGAICAIEEELAT
jgi:hypothetical protein